MAEKHDRSLLPGDKPMPLFRALLLAASLIAGASALAEPIVVSGVKYEDAAEVRGSRLQLNGAGVRYRGPFKVYAAGLYTTRKAGSTDEVLAAPGAKRVSLTMLREIDAAELGKLFTRSVEDNMDKASFPKMIPGLMRMSQIFTDHKKLMPGDTITIDWVPGTGTVIGVRGVAQGEPFREPEFYNALLRIWLGPNPADWKLKEAMLGKVG
jgi:hypothetical protein